MILYYSLITIISEIELYEPEKGVHEGTTGRHQTKRRRRVKHLGAFVQYMQATALSKRPLGEQAWAKPARQP